MPIQHVTGRMVLVAAKVHLCWTNCKHYLYRTKQPILFFVSDDVWASYPFSYSGTVIAALTLILTITTTIQKLNCNSKMTKAHLCWMKCKTCPQHYHSFLHHRDVTYVVDCAQLWLTISCRYSSLRSIIVWVCPYSIHSILKMSIQFTHCCDNNKILRNIMSDYDVYLLY